MMMTQMLKEFSECFKSMLPAIFLLYIFYLSLESVDVVNYANKNAFCISSLIFHPSYFSSYFFILFRFHHLPPAIRSDCGMGSCSQRITRFGNRVHRTVELFLESFSNGYTNNNNKSGGRRRSAWSN